VVILNYDVNLILKLPLYFLTLNHDMTLKDPKPPASFPLTWINMYSLWVEGDCTAGIVWWWTFPRSFSCPSPHYLSQQQDSVRTRWTEIQN